jgi:hypothetical protein
LKILKLTLIAFTLIFMSCKSDDDKSVESTPIDIIPDINIDIDKVIALPANSDITALVDFLGIPAADYLAELNENDNLILAVPQNLQAGDRLMYSRFDFFFPGDIVPIDFADLAEYLDLSFPTDTEFLPNPDIPGTNVSSKYQFKAVMAMDVIDIDFKYDIECYIVRNDVFFGPYTIDPKIRIKSNN